MTQLEMFLELKFYLGKYTANENIDKTKKKKKRKRKITHCLS